VQPSWASTPAFEVRACVTSYGCEYPDRMEYMEPGDPLPRGIPTAEEMLAEFGQPLAVLERPIPGSKYTISGGGSNGQIKYLDIDYFLGQQLVARVRTVRELSSPPAHAELGDLLRSALLEFSVNAETIPSDSIKDPGRPRGQRLTAEQEQLATVAAPADAELSIDGRPQDAITLQIHRYRAYQTVRGKTTVIHVGTDDVAPPALRIAASPSM